MSGKKPSEKPVPPEPRPADFRDTIRESSGSKPKNPENPDRPK